jgi:hypothetical protein
MSAWNSHETRYFPPSEMTDVHCTYFQGKISKDAFLLAVLLSWHSDTAPFSFKQIAKMADDAERPASESALRRYLAELVDAKCLIVRESGKSQAAPQTA